MRLSRSIQFLLLAAISLALVAGTPAYSQATFTPVNGFALLTGPPEGGDVKCIGGYPTGPWPPCSPGSKTQLRNAVLNFYQVFPALPQFTGTRTCILNANLDADGKGHAWGTWRVDGQDGTVAEGTFTNSISGWFAPSAGKAVGRVTEGEREGDHVFLTLIYDKFPFDPSNPSAFAESMDGYLLSPPKGKK